MNLRMSLSSVIHGALGLSFLAASGLAQAGAGGLGQALSDHGWQVETERNGTLVVYVAPASGRPAVDRRADATEMQQPGAVAIEPETRPLVARLAAAGWHAMRQTDGSVVFSTQRRYSAPA